MTLKVDDEYYCSVTDFYTTQISRVEQELETFRGICDSVFATNDFGTCLQEVLMEMYNEFYTEASGKLQTLISEVSAAVMTFTGDIEQDDKLM